jgi:thiamine-monophosphate kinase
MAEIDALLDGVLEMAADARLSVAGGNITRSPGPLIVDVTVTGHVRPRRILTRGGGRPGDSLYVSGSIGAAAAGLEWLRNTGGTRPKADEITEPPDDQMSECIKRHRRPEPRLRLGALLGRTRTASACMDLSDGLADAVTGIAEASGTGAVIEASSLPIHPGAVDWFSERGQDPVSCALSSGDDYELLFSIGQKAGGRLRGVLREARGVRLTRIGQLTGDPAVTLLRNGQPERLPPGFAHF